MNENYIIQMKGIMKSYPGVLAVDNVDLHLNRGEILALVGENGAGKSTLIKILAGAREADKGEIIIKGNSYTGYSPAKALDIGIGVIYQELNYLNDISIAENIFIGRYPTKGPLKMIDYKSLGSQCKLYMDKVGLNHSPFAEVSTLSVAEKQLLEIAKSASRYADVLIFDEPTSALNHTETQSLFSLMKDFVKNGNAIIFVSHKLDEVFSISNRIQVMRDGKSVADLETSKTNVNEVIRHMVGREVKDTYPVYEKTIGKESFSLKNLSTEKVNNISLNVKKGEIVGLFGLMGAGRSEIAKAIYGAVKKLSGEIYIEGRKVEINTPEQAIKNGIAYVPSERKTEGLVIDSSIKENVTLASLKQLRKKLDVIDDKKEKQIVADWVNKLSIKTNSIKTEVSSLSGGNQQKVVIAKALMSKPKIIILNEPTKGVDVGAKVEIYKIMGELCKEGFSFILISSELPEIMAISDRIIIICEGKITGECSKAEYSPDLLMNYAIGGNVS